MKSGVNRRSSTLDETLAALQARLKSVVTRPGMHGGLRTLIEDTGRNANTVKVLRLPAQLDAIVAHIRSLV